MAMGQSHVQCVSGCQEREPCDLEARGRARVAGDDTGWRDAELETI